MWVRKVCNIFLTHVTYGRDRLGLCRWRPLVWSRGGQGGRVGGQAPIALSWLKETPLMPHRVGGELQGKLTAALDDILGELVKQRPQPSPRSHSWCESGWRRTCSPTTSPSSAFSSATSTLCRASLKRLSCRKCQVPFSPVSIWNVHHTSWRGKHAITNCHCCSINRM